MKTFQRLLCALCLLAIPAIAPAQDSSLEPIKQLLSMPAPTPRTVEEPAEEKPQVERPPEFFDARNPPADTAPIEDLLSYWSRWAQQNGRHAPTDAVRERLLEKALTDPELLETFRPLLPQTSAAARQVKEVFDKAVNDAELGENWREKMREWLVFNSKYFFDELLAQAQKVRDNEKYSSVDKDEALEALARVDWSAAEPLLQSLANGSQPRSRAVALAILYKQAISSKDSGAEEKYRTLLQAIATDKLALGHARNTAIDTLLLTEWAGRDDWYLSLFQDGTLLALHDGSSGFSPLTTLFAQDPEKWIPVMTRLVESRDLNIRSAAVSCLVTFQNQRARKDALKPVLPWLSNPEWVKESSDNRLRLIQSMSFIDLPESVPGLISVVEQGDPRRVYQRSYAAESLAKYKDPRAVPALKKAVVEEKNEGHRLRFIHGLIACGGLTESEQVDALTAFAERMLTAEGQEEIMRYRGYGDDPLPLEISIGKFLARGRDASDGLVRAVLARAEFVKKSKPTVSQALLEIAHQWQGRLIDLDMISRIGSGAADADTIAKAIERRTKLRESVEVEIRALFAGRGVAPGIAAVLTDDANMADSILQSGSGPARVALLASARLAQMPLAVATVGRLMRSEDALLATAAERYLLVEDSPEARLLLWERHPNQAFVTGWRENIQLDGGNNFELLGTTEEKLRAELFKEKSPLEIFALIANSEYYSHVLRIYPDRAIYTNYEDPARHREYVVTKDQLSAFRSSIAANRIEELGPQIGSCHHNCWVSEFLALSKSKGRRVFSHQGGSWLAVLASFEMLAGSGNARTHYALEKEISGLEVLYESGQVKLKDVWHDGADVHILVEREETPEEIAEGKKADEKEADVEDEQAARIEKQTRERARLDKLLSWRLLENGRAGRITKSPAGYATVDEAGFRFDTDTFPLYLNEYLSQATAGDFVVLAAKFDGLWKQQVGQKAVRITGKAAYADPIVTGDGKWAIAAKSDSDWGVPNYVVRVNLQTSKEHRIELPPADNLGAIAFLPLQDRVLLRRAKDDDSSGLSTAGPDQPEYYLVNAATGETELVKGVFAPFLEERKRFLQPTGRANEYWAAIPDRMKNQTRVGRYSLKDFSFTEVLVAPQILFDSGSMWVDEIGARLYLVYEGQLIRMPLQTAK
jgi:PBS lyase HEAT-like repeat